MKVRIEEHGIVTVPDYCKRKLARIKRDSGTEAVYLKLSDDRKYVEVHSFYVPGYYRMRILG